MEEFSWFDEKYKDGGKANLEDRAELFRQIEIPLSDRAKRKIEDKLKEMLFNLRKEYKPSLQIIAYEFLYCLGSFFLDKSQYDKYDKMYREAVEKHAKEIVFSRNFE